MKRTALSNIEKLKKQIWWFSAKTIG